MERLGRDIKRLVRAAMGDIKADLVVSGAKLLNVYSGELLEGLEVSILDGRICYVGPSAAHTTGPGTERLEARGLIMAPGFVDAHTHIGHFCRPYEYLQAYLPHGTTSLVASCDELVAVFGFRGLELFLSEVGAHPSRVFTMVPMVSPQDPLLCSARSLAQEEVAKGLADPRILGLGEVVSWLRLTQGDGELIERLEMARRERKIVHGHTAGARDRRLCAVAAAGISSCHEPIREEDVLELLRLGYWVMLREGTFRRDLASTLKPILERGLPLHRLMLVTDSMAPDDVARDGHLDFVVRRAISLGLPPVRAIQAVTLNPAVYSGLEQEIGGIAPGRCADFNLLSDLEKVEVHSTWIGGKLVAREGQSLVDSGPMTFPEDTVRSLGLSRVSPDAFRVPCVKSPAKIRVMELVSANITAEAILELQARGGYLEADQDRDLLKVAVFDRHGKSGRAALGFLKGLGARVGAIGTTVNLDEYTLLVAGSDDRDMALCANSLIAAGGGIAVVDRGEVLEKIDFSLGGVASLAPWQEVARDLSRLHRCLRERGSPFPKPVYPLCFLTFVTLPALRITAKGLVAVKERKLVPLFVEE